MLRPASNANGQLVYAHISRTLVTHSRANLVDSWKCLHITQLLSGHWPRYGLLMVSFLLTSSIMPAASNTRRPLLTRASAKLGSMTLGRPTKPRGRELRPYTNLAPPLEKDHALADRPHTYLHLGPLLFKRHTSCPTMLCGRSLLCSPFTS